MFRVVSMGVAAALAAGVAAADEGPAAGQRIYQDFCASCHVVRQGEPPRHPEAPSFEEIARMYPPDSLAEAFVEGLMSGHPDMPSFEFTEEESVQLIQFLESLRSAE